MQINSIRLRTVVSPIYGTVIHGQGQKKKYCFIEVDTAEGVCFSEIYPALYSSHLVQAAIAEISKRICGSEFPDTDALHHALHIPFISGAGTYAAVTAGVLNAIDHRSGLTIDTPLHKFQPYLSGGTVKTSLKQMEKEILLCESQGYNNYKIRLDYRDEKDCKKKIDLLNASDVRYAVDFICNTNHVEFDEQVLIALIDRMNVDKVEWIEEPVVPHYTLNRLEFLSAIQKRGFVIGLGESLTSPLELLALDQTSSIGLIQLDATINGRYKELKEFVKGCSSRLGAHNWGSLITSLQNAHLFNGVTKDVHFEIPIYETEFDGLISEVLFIQPKKIESWPNHAIILDERVERVIAQFEVENYGDFSWS